MRALLDAFHRLTLLQACVASALLTLTYVAVYQLGKETEARAASVVIIEANKRIDHLNERLAAALSARTETAARDTSL